jgi:hypothetical protein
LTADVVQENSQISVVCIRPSLFVSPDVYVGPTQLAAVTATFESVTSPELVTV